MARPFTYGVVHQIADHEESAILEDVGTAAGQTFCNQGLLLLRPARSGDPQRDGEVGRGRVSRGYSLCECNEIMLDNEICLDSNTEERC